MAAPGERARSGDDRAAAGTGDPAAEAAQSLRERLLAFFDDRGRDLPWRRTDDPYHIWVSEVMLQQTRVEAVIPYYERWLARFPTLQALADAPLDTVLKAWEGLGYYSRARNLHRAAGVVRERHGGELPADPAALRGLPGVGDYTAGAIASIAFGLPEPAVDGNVRRVFSRLFDLPDPAPAELQRLAAGLVPAGRPGDFNQALMELGATVCTPRSPRCDACPVAELCRARARGVQGERPRPRAARTVPEEAIGTAVVVSAAGRLLLVRRPEGGLLAGLWSFPEAAAGAGEAPGAAAARAVRERLGLEAPPGEPLGTVSHAFTHRRHTYHAFRFVFAGEGGFDFPDHAWALPEELERYALPVAQRKIAALARAAATPPRG